MSRDYKQFCGLARAMELVGGRWTLLIVRDLLAGRKRFTDLRAGLPGIPTNVLTARLRELEDGGLVHRTVLPRPATGVAYELTDYGRDLEQAIVTLGIWGARTMGPRREDDFVSVPALGLGLRGMFRADAAAAGVDCSYELRIDGDPLRVSIRDGSLTVGDPTDGAPDVVISTDADTMHALLTGVLDLRDVAASGDVEIQGSRAAAERFFQMFRIGAPVEPVTASR
jgi:DNA-binding HxlR family transcriptional regulator/putative sterol carrier protein